MFQICQQCVISELSKLEDINQFNVIPSKSSKTTFNAPFAVLVNGNGNIIFVEMENGSHLYVQMVMVSVMLCLVVMMAPQLSVVMTVCTADYMDLNQSQYALVGNIKKNHYFDITYQNLQGWQRVCDVQISIDTILSKYHPDIVGFGEIGSDKISQCSYAGYKFVRGKLKESNNPRISLIIKEC